ncbi:MAG TPA: hypothetical protein VIG36_08575 [Methylocystis sp.]|jgi:hypothetical protein
MTPTLAHCAQLKTSLVDSSRPVLVGRARVAFAQNDRRRIVLHESGLSADGVDHCLGVRERTRTDIFDAFTLGDS